MTATRSILVSAVVGGTLAAVPSLSFGLTQIDTNAPGKSVDKDIFGSTFQHHRQWVKTGNNASMVGIAGGLLADSFNWQTLTNTSTPWSTYWVMKTLQDDWNSEFIPIVNMRGFFDVGDNVNFKTGLAPLVTLASDWVRYTNGIIQSGQQYGSLSASDKAIIDKINPAGEPVLPGVGEAAPPPVKYWIIGNEPEAHWYGTRFTSIPNEQGIYWSTAEYVNRYKQITSAMKAQDPTIKVGPGMLGANDPIQMTSAPLLQSDATIDFWAYHSYDNLGDVYVVNGDAFQVNQMRTALKGVRQKQLTALADIKQMFTANGRDPNNVEFMVTEWNPMGNEGGDWTKPSQTSMYKALAMAESFFTFADMGVKSANYWGETVVDNTDPNPSHIYPQVKLWWKLSDEMGDTLINSIIDNPGNRRVYTTKDSQTGEIKVWGINLSNSSSTTINLSLLGIDPSQTALLSIFGGDGTRYWTEDADWSTPLALINFNAGNFNLTIPSSSIVLLQVMPVPEPAMLGLIGLGLLAMRRRRAGDM
jgi:MYXO-CTERM domain-containing protein